MKRLTRVTAALLVAAVAASLLIGSAGVASGIGSLALSEISVPATIQPGETLNLSWRVVAAAGLDTVTTNDGGTAPGTWAKIGGPPGWVSWCPFPMFTSRTSGTATDGRYATSCTLPASLPNGEYSVWITALDTTGTYAENGGIDTFTVVGGSSDAQPPVVSEVTAAPSPVAAGGSLTLKWRAQDATGGASIIAWAYGPNGRLTDDAVVFWLGYDVPPTLVSGDARDGRYQVTLPVSATAAAGTYIIWFSVQDVLGNREASLYPDGFGTVYATYEVAAGSTTVPGVPTSLSVQSASTGAARVAFTQPSSGTSKILDYDARWSTDPSFASGVTFVEAGTTTTAWIDVASLKAGTTYYFQVRAENRSGPGSWSSASNAFFLPASLPGAASGLTATQITASSYRIGFLAAPDGGSPVLDYDLQYSTVAMFSRSVTFVEAGTSPATSITLSGLKRGTTYYVRVRATNAVGDGPWSTVITIRT
ncbi:MAG: fibronectin type III domain-containing protein [Actinomycetota bacterium]